jgi:hypothetical protein
MHNVLCVFRLFAPSLSPRGVHYAFGGCRAVARIAAKQPHCLSAGEFGAVLSEIEPAKQTLAPSGFDGAKASVFGSFCRDWQKELPAAALAANVSVTLYFVNR